TLVSVLGTPGLTHRVSWINGRLVFHDHPDGIDNPETLAFEALAGERSCGCRLLRDWWRSQDGKISYLGPSIMIEDDRFRAAHQLRQQVTAKRERARQNETVDRWSQQLLTRT